MIGLCASCTKTDVCAMKENDVAHCFYFRLKEDESSECNQNEDDKETLA